MVPAVEGPNAKNTKCSIRANRPSEGPNAPISTIATITMVTLPSMIGVRPRAKPLFSAPSRDLPERSSSLMRSAVMTLASTPMPMARIMPAMPGRVRVKLSKTGKYPDTKAKVAATCPSRAMLAKNPGRRYRTVIKQKMRPKAMHPASTMAPRLFSPKVGLTVE